ncbi:aldehyde dehydrogenase family protein [Mycobacteroides franklinii]|uniref:aldehyde dehydrogenase family protein n=1 Tax=Mycobacteroides franklinii TaxID=948102 RepID=UPI0008AA355D
MTAVSEPCADEQVVVRDPRTGRVVGRYQAQSTAEVADVVAVARTASAWWGLQSFRYRREVLLTIKKTIARELDSFAGAISQETGKPDSDARLETILTVEYLDWAARNAERVLRPRKARVGVTVALQQISRHLHGISLGGVGVGYRPGYSIGHHHRLQ